MSKEVNWQQECLKKGFEYVREPDDHYVVASPAEMVALLRDLLGVDVRTKDCDSYGVAVCELQEQIDGLVNTLHAQQAERDALLAELDALREALKAQRWELSSPNISYALRDQLLGQLAGDHEPEEILCVEDFYSWLANAIDNIRADHRKAEGGQPMQVRASALQGAQP